MFLAGRDFDAVADMEQYLQYVGGTAGVLALTGVAAASAYYYANRGKPMMPPFDLDQQTIPEGPEMIHYSRFAKDGKDMKYMKYLYDDCRTLYDVFRRGARVSNNGPCLGARESPSGPYHWIRYEEALLRAQNFGSGLVALGLQPGPQTLVGIYSQNCPEWILAEQGLYCYSMVIVPLYDTLGPEACRYIIRQADMSTVICETEAKCRILMDKRPASLKRLICIKPVSNDTIQAAKASGLDVLYFEDVERLGAEKKNREVPPQPKNLCTICYTSGTTGNPKGVMLSHENIVADVSATLLQLGDQKPTFSDVMISFLPLAHMLERVCEVATYMQGGAVGFFSGDIRHLMDDMKALRPTITPAVPRLLNRIFDKVQAGLNGSNLKRFLFSTAMGSKERDLKRGIIRNNTIWDKLVFRKVQESMGGRVRLLVVGSAPLAGSVLTFMRCALGCVIVEGYGQTECVAPATLTIQGDCTPEHVGPPIPCCSIKLVDVPEMQYYAAAGQGEICIQGANVFMGYFKEPEKTRETLDEQGWLHTGDIGTWLPNGTLKIIDRKKHIFKLSQGEYIAPEKIENVYVNSQYVAQVFVHGESLKSCTVGVFVPDVDALKRWANENSIPGTLSVLCARPDVKKLIMDDVIDLGKKAGLKSFEQIKDVYLHPDPFSVQNGLLTPTLKSKRPELRAYFKPQIEDMYSKLE